MPFAPHLLRSSREFNLPHQGLIAQRGISEQEPDHSAETVNPLAHLVHHIPGTPSPSEQAHDLCAKDYAHDRVFLEFIQVAQIEIILRTSAESMYNNSSGTVLPPLVPGTEGFTFTGRTYVTNPRCKEMVFGYPTDLYKGKIPEEAGNDPYRYYEIYLEKAKNNPEYIVSGVGKLKMKGPDEPLKPGEVRPTEAQLRETLDEINRKLFRVLRRHLGGEDAAEVEAKKIHDEDRRKAFLVEAWDLATKEQVERLSRKYQKPASNAPPVGGMRVPT